MNIQQMKEILHQRAAKINAFLTTVLERESGSPQRLRDAMLYSLQAGGKRIRPVLCLASAAFCGISEEIVIPFAAGIEMIHTYSLIHDDLPAMDNDDLRRGLPANHKQFDEATAILAGDGLLTDAFALMASTDLPASALLAAIMEIAQAAGSGGMVGGQMLDMQYTGASAVSLAQVAEMQAMKTGAILRASCACGALLAQAPEVMQHALSVYGAALGKAFQITDDILDITGSQEELGKPVGSDEKSGKNTYPALIGLAQSRKLADDEIKKAKAAIAPYPGNDFLGRLADYVVERSA